MANARTLSETKCYSEEKKTDHDKINIKQEMNKKTVIDQYVDKVGCNGLQGPSAVSTAQPTTTTHGDDAVDLQSAGGRVSPTAGYESGDAALTRVS